MPFPILAPIGAWLLGTAATIGAVEAADAILDPTETPATMADLAAVFALLDSCPVSDPALRRYKADLIATVPTITQAQALDLRGQALIDAQAKCAAATFATPPTPQPATADQMIPQPPDNAPAWYWLVFAIVTALIILGKPGKGGKK